LSPELQAELRRQTVVMARALRVVGLMNVQFAIQRDADDGPVVYVLEVNPRASRTVPFVSKATGRPLAKIAARCMVGRTLKEQRISAEIVPRYYSVKEAVFPFIKFPGVDTILGPEMKSTGEVMGVGETFAEAFLKSQLAAGIRLPEAGKVFISLRNADKARAIDTARQLHELGYQIVATRGTAAAFTAAGVPVTPVNKVAEGRPLAKIAARCMVGKPLREQGVVGEIVPRYFSVKEAVFPFIKFPGVDTILGPEMKSTGEVMGVGETFAEAFLKSQLAAGIKLPESGNVFISLRNADKARAIDTARKLHALGYRIVATRGTAAALAAAGVPVTPVNKVAEGRPHIVDMIVNDEIALVINTVEEKRSAIHDSYAIRRAALHDEVPTFTTLAGARAAAIGMEHMRDLVPYALQRLHATL
jgi:vacuolar-type H+-ATPase subunit E/Vma4